MNSWPSLWISDFLCKPENAFMCVIDENFIRDEFNLFGLSEVVPGFRVALRAVLGDSLIRNHRSLTGPELLYGLVHARFVMTEQGVQKMLKKYDAGCFGHCSRIACKRPANFLPVGLDDEAGKSLVRLYCPQCMEVYFPPKVAIEALVDGAYFGTSFPEMVFMTRPECRPLWPKIQHVSRIYGFKIHSSGIELQQRYATMKKSSSSSTTAYRRIINDDVSTAVVDSGTSPSSNFIIRRQQTSSSSQATARRLTGVTNVRQSATPVTSVRNPNVTARRPTNVAVPRPFASSVRKSNVDK